MREHPEDLHQVFHLPVHPNHRHDHRVGKIRRTRRGRGRRESLARTELRASQRQLRPEFRLLLDVMEQAVFGLDRNGCVVLTNRKADLIAASGDGLRMVSKRLAAASDAQRAALNSLIRNCLEEGDAASSSKHLNLRRISELTPYSALHLTLLPVNAASVIDQHELALLIIVTDLALEPLPRATALCRLFSLTPTEGRVSDLLLQGLNAVTIASRLRVTEGTARGYVKSILAKTGTRRQSELMRLMLSLPGTYRAGSEGSGRTALLAGR